MAITVPDWDNNIINNSITSDILGLTGLSNGSGSITSSISIGGSINFSGVNSYFSIPASSDWAVGTGDFTVEWFQYQTSADALNFPRVFSVKAHPLCSIGVSIENGVFMLWLGANAIIYANVTLTNYLNRWVHFAICRSGTSLKVFKDGTSISSFSNAIDVTNTTDPLIIGNDFSFESITRFPGYITNFRFINGTALYTGNFSIPTSPLSAVTNTKLLLLAVTGSSVKTDSSGLNKTITSTNAAWVSNTPFS